MATATVVVTSAMVAAAVTSAAVARRTEKQIEESVATAITIITHLYIIPFILVFGQRFSPLPILHNMKSAGEKFHPRLCYLRNYLPKYLFKRPAKPAPCLASSLAIS